MNEPPPLLRDEIVVVLQLVRVTATTNDRFALALDALSTQSQGTASGPGYTCGPLLHTGRVKSLSRVTIAGALASTLVAVLRPLLETPEVVPKDGEDARAAGSIIAAVVDEFARQQGR